MDVQELDAASHNSVDNIREIRVQVTMVAAGPSAHRVFILDEAHMLSAAACNALLKTLEEPPPNVHFILATTEPYKLLDTIRSRSQRFDFHPVPSQVLAAHLRWVAEQEGYVVVGRALETVARHAQGSVRDSLSLLEQVAALGDGEVSSEGVEQALGVANRATMTELAQAVADRDAPAVLALVAHLDRGGVNLRSFIADAIGFFRGVYLAHHLPSPESVVDEPGEIVRDWKEAAGVLGVSETNRVIDQLGEALIKIREGREERLMLEMALLWIVRPETSIHPAALLKRIEALEARIGEGRIAGTSARIPEGRSAKKPVTASSVPVGPSPVSSASVERKGPSKTESSPEPADAASPAVGSAESGTVTLSRLQDLWPAVVEGFGGIDRALLRITTPAALQGHRLVIDCSDKFRRDRLEERNVPSRLRDELEKRLGQRFKMEFVVQQQDDVSVAATDESQTPPPPPSDPPPEEANAEPPPRDNGAEHGESGSASDSETKTDPSESVDADQSDQDLATDPVGEFFDAADISVTEVQRPPGQSLF